MGAEAGCARAYVAYFFGAIFLANFIPHFVSGISGAPFRARSSSPPGEGLSSSVLNVVWGLMNLAVAYLLLLRVGTFDIRRWRHIGVFAVGFATMSLLLARHFGRFHGGST